MRDIIIVGAGSVGGHIASNAEEYGIADQIIGFLDDDPQKQHTEFCGFPVISNLNWLHARSDLSVILGIAFPRIKKKIYDQYLQQTNFHYPTIIHPRAWMSGDCAIGSGSIIYPNTSINFKSEIGEFCVLNMNCAVGHNAKIGNFSSLAPGISLGGHTTIEDQVDIGIGASTLQNVCIGSGSIIGGQSMVINSFPQESKIKGIPAK